MGGFAVGRGSPLSGSDPEPVGAPAPVPFWDALGEGAASRFDDFRETRNTDVRQQALRAALYRNHEAAEKALGRKLPRSAFMLDVERQDDYLATRFGGTPQVLPNREAVADEDYAASLGGLIQQHQLTGVMTAEQVVAQVDQHLRGVRARADEASSQGWGGAIGSFLGGAAGAMTDPVNAAGLAYGLGGGRGLLTRMVEQAALNGSLELTQIPGRMRDAKLAGPEYTPSEAATDVVTAAGGAALFEGGGHLVGKGVGAVARRLRPAADAEPAVRATLDLVQQASRDDAAIGALRGEDYDRAAESLATEAPPPRIAPDQDLAELFTPGGAPETAAYKGRPISAQSFDPANLQTDAARFQYKADADASGVTARLRGVEAWDPLAAGRVLVWEDRAGTQYIADGHQRFGLVRRLNDEKGFEHSLDGYLFREADGWTAQDLRVVAALKNIREGSGAPLDAAKVFRDAPQALTDRSLPVTGEFMAQARGLAQLSDPAFGAVVNKVIPERYGAEIGSIAAQRPDLHEDMVALMKAAAPANQDEARALVMEALQDDWIRTQGDQTDLFGYDPSQSAMIGRAKVAATVKRALARDARLFGGLIKHADAIEAGGNALARDANQARLAIDQAALEVTAKLALRHGPIGEAMAEAAKKVMAGESPASASKAVLARLREAIEAGEDLEQLRGATLDPKPPSEAGQQLAAAFDDPNGPGAKAQAVEAPEDLEAEAPAGLFDDLEATASTHEKAHQALVACAPAGE